MRPWWVGWCALVAACGGAPPGVAPTYHQDVAPLLAGHCQGCHSPGGAGPFALASYEQARALAPALVAATATGKMPPWGARPTAECQPRFGWQGDIRLSAAQIELLRAWAEGGAPEGDPMTPAPLPVPPATGLSRVDLEVASPPYAPTGSGDQFRCFVMDPGLERDRFLTGTDVIPGDPAVVHHVVVIADPSRAASKRLAGGDGYDCFGGFSDIPDNQLLQVWTPGGFPVEMPEGVAVQLPRGSLIVMQVHYHAHGPGHRPAPIRFQLRAQDQPPRYYLVPGLPMGNAVGAVPGGDGLLPGPGDGRGGPTFRIPANARGHTETMRFTWPAVTPEGKPMAAGALRGLAAHMHYIGRDLKLEIERAVPRGEPARECLTEEPAWDFDWQRSYAYDAPLEALPTIAPGDRLTLRCTYDNSPSNPFVRRALADAGRRSPSDVVLGESSLDEMCLVLMQLLVKAD
jgi:hypothetical protein